MEIKKVVDIDTLTDDEREAFDSGLKTEEDFLSEYETSLTAKETEKEERLKKAEELANNYKIRAEKAEGKYKGDKEKSDETHTNDSLSQKDLIAIMKADVNEEDIDEVISFAKLKNVSVSDALKSNIVKTILAEKNEERTTANATNTGNARRGTAKPNASQILENARKGELPDSDEDMAALVRHRRGM